MALKLAEGIVDEINVYFQAHMGAKVDALNAEYNDAIALEYPAAYYVGEKSLISIPQFPAVFILARGSTIERYNATFTDAGHDVDIGVIVLERDANPEYMQKRVYRYLRAFWELVVERFFATTPDDYYTEQGASMRFSPVMTSKSGEEFMADGILSARFGKQEDKP